MTAQTAQDKSEPRQSLSWQADWRTTLFTLFFVPVFISLGFWQLDRAEEKADIAQAWELRQAQSAVSLLEVDGDAEQLAHRRVALEGAFLPGRDFLLDNRMQAGRYGFEVISPFRLQEEPLIVLVNRGWIAGDPARRELPSVPPAQGTLQRGTIYVPPGEAYRLGDEMRQADWPQVVLSLDVPWMEQVLGEPVYPFTIRLDAESQAALSVDWPVINVRPEKHQGYAVQWFAMAIALTLLWVAYSSNLIGWWKSKRGGQPSDG